ncbi:OLC1v1016491C1 [Oldenlandia corymbosa var. corymbosa]|uniref:OLC1v1016491C1 n=1 Tax=Oldenlandia corymbosa var. corymbosa TaxID=529605 RepID=A0AAV1E5J8_OLDCO|nr:OLC1v1016491C1 [Oldenlandia corymbosa var. corymbosa]
MAEDRPLQTKANQGLNPNRSDAQITKGLKPNPRLLSSSMETLVPSTPTILSEPTVYKGEPSFILSKEEDDRISNNRLQRRTLILRLKVLVSVDDSKIEEQRKKKHGHPKGSKNGVNNNGNEGETRRSVNKLEELKQSLHFDKAISSITGKIWIFWTNDFDVTLLGDSEQALHLDVKHLQSSTQFLIIAVYAKSTRKGRNELWKELTQFRNQHLGDPWMMGSDFNVIHNLDEYSGNSQPDQAAIEDFNQWINFCDLTEIQTIGSDYTWVGNRQNGWVLKKLDRILYTEEWLSLFPISTVQHLNRASSDHSPLLHQFNHTMESRPRLFRFQKMWLRRQSFLSMVKQNWDQPVQGYGMYAFSAKLRRLKAHMKE